MPSKLTMKSFNSRPFTHLQPYVPRYGVILTVLVGGQGYLVKIGHSRCIYLLYTLTFGSSVGTAVLVWYFL